MKLDENEKVELFELMLYITTNSRDNVIKEISDYIDERNSDDINAISINEFISSLKKDKK